jgi:septal ring factor EnvC (AmiA/AmiB activator)
MTEGNKQEVNGDRNRLYVELRHAGEPINPIPWFSKRTNKVNR